MMTDAMRHIAPYVLGTREFGSSRRYLAIQLSGSKPYLHIAHHQIVQCPRHIEWATAELAKFRMNMMNMREASMIPNDEKAKSLLREGKYCDEDRSEQVNVGTEFCVLLRSCPDISYGGSHTSPKSGAGLRQGQNIHYFPLRNTVLTR